MAARPFTRSNRRRSTRQLRNVIARIGATNKPRPEDRRHRVEVLGRFVVIGPLLRARITITAAGHPDQPNWIGNAPSTATACVVAEFIRSALTAPTILS